MKILLVEDEGDVRDAFTILLRDQGADVVAVADGTAALSAALVRDFDVVVTDYGLPDIPGAFVVRQLLAVARRRPRVIVVTAYGEPYTKWAQQAGADLVLTKPVEWPALLDDLHAAHRRLAA